MFSSIFNLFQPNSTLFHYLCLVTTDSQAPVVSYATAYPVALILMTIIAKVIIQTIGGVVGI